MSFFILEMSKTALSFSLFKERTWLIRKLIVINSIIYLIINKYLLLKDSNHPSISWKLSNISSIINKETNPFKFNEYQWKLVAKMEDDKITGKILRIYLKLESNVANSSANN